LIRGSVPGSKGTWIEIRDAVKGVKVDDLPLPGKFSVAEALKAEAAPKTETAPKAEAKTEADAPVEAKPSGEEK